MNSLTQGFLLFAASTWLAIFGLAARIKKLERERGDGKSGL